MVAGVAFLLVTIVSPICEAIFDWICCHPYFDDYGPKKYDTTQHHSYRPKKR